MQIRARPNSRICSLGRSWIHVVFVSSWQVLLQGHRLDTRTLHERAHLSRHFFENLLVEVASGDALVELDELHDVARDELTHRIAQAAVVAIELLHEAEVSIAHTNDDN